MSKTLNRLLEFLQTTQGLNLKHATKIFVFSVEMQKNFWVGEVQAIYGQPGDKGTYCIKREFLIDPEDQQKLLDVFEITSKSVRTIKYKPEERIIKLEEYRF